MSDLRIGSAARKAMDRELADFINAERVTPDTLAEWAVARGPELAQQLDAVLQWFAGRQGLPVPALAGFHPEMRALFDRLVVAVLTADP